MSLLQIERLTASHAGVAVLKGVSLSVARGELVGLLGPNGSGKTSLLLAAVGLLPAEGDVVVGGDALSALTPQERARRAAFLPQEREIEWAVPVKALVALGRLPHRPAAAALSKVDHDAVAAAMTAMDVAALSDRPATTLSGGERARVLIARALAQEAPLLLADEPTAGLDPAHQIALMQVFKELARKGSGVLCSLHDLSLAALFCDRLIVLKDGRKIAEGEPVAVLTEALLAEVYGVRAIIEKREVGRFQDGRLTVTPYGLSPLKD